MPYLFCESPLATGREIRYNGHMQINGAAPAGAPSAGEDTPMPNTKLTKEKLSVHFHYGKMIYVLIIVVAMLIGNLTYTMSAYHAPNERRIDIELIGNYADTSTPGALEAAAHLLAAGQEAERVRDAAQGIDTAAGDYEAPLQAETLTGMFDTLSYDPTGKYLAIVAFSQNQDTAAAVLQEMIDMFEPDEAETDGSEAAETAEAAQ